MSDTSVVALETAPCPLGCRAGDEFLFSGKDRINNLPGEFTLIQCKHCGLIRTNPRPTSVSIGHYYPDTYGPYSTKRADAAAHGSTLKKLIRRVYAVLFPYRNQILPPVQPGYVLEVGCASGVFLEEMRRAGWQCEGIEYSEHAAEQARARGFRVQASSIADATPPVHMLDLVCAWMVIEHLHDPVASLTKLALWTKPGGHLAISVPNAGSFEFGVFRERWYALHLPNHLYHFSPRTITHVLERGGWRVVRIVHHRSLTNVFRSIGYLLADANAPEVIVRPFRGGGALLHAFLYPLSMLLAAFGQTGRMTVWAVKK